MRKLTIVLVLMLIATPLACQKRGADAPDQIQTVAAERMANAAMDKSSDYAATAENPGPTRKIILEHNLTIEVKVLDDSFAVLQDLVHSVGGYITESNRHKRSDGSMGGWITMRVPTAEAGRIIDKFRKLGKILSETSTGTDITDQYYDLDARLRNQQAAEKRLLTLLDMEAAKLQDILAVERELTRVRGQVEGMEARKRNWDTLTENTTITVELQEPSRAVPAARRIWDPIRTAFGESLEAFANSLHFVIVFIGIAIPWIILGALALYGLLQFRAWRKRRAKGKG